MSGEAKDPAIRLFGQTIPLPRTSFSLPERKQEQNKDDNDDEKEQFDRNGCSSDGSSSRNNSKILKKPDKILPCPRCNSMDTKFCYYNNYNVNQPRHFCKSCQRYWTAGGTLRKVLEGAGRRKNKKSDSNQQLTYHWSPVPFPQILAYWVPLLPQPSSPISSSGGLGKRSRDGSEWTDPREAAKSSIGSDPPGYEKNRLIFQANPAAYSRSLHFHEAI